jgi:hypothetical protein
MLSSILIALTRFTRCFSGLMICSIYLDKSITRIESRTTITSLCTFSEQLDSLLDRLDNRCMILEASLLIAGVGNKMAPVTVAV